MHGNYQNRQNNIKDEPVKEMTTPVEESAIAEPEASVAITEDPVAKEVLTETDEKKSVLAVVVGCGKLNVREKPDKAANILTTVPSDSEVMVNLDGSTADFYKVCTAVGIEGFCMKQYIAIY